MASTKTQTPKPTISDEQYKELLANRLAAMKGFEAGTVTAEEKNLARKLVRDARKVRASEAGILEQTRKAAEDAKAKRSASAQKAAATRAAKKSEKPAVKGTANGRQSPEQITTQA